MSQGGSIAIAILVKVACKQHSRMDGYLGLTRIGRMVTVMVKMLLFSSPAPIAAPALEGKLPVKNG